MDARRRRAGNWTTHKSSSPPPPPARHHIWHLSANVSFLPFPAAAGIKTQTGNKQLPGFKTMRTRLTVVAPLFFYCRRGEARRNRHQRFSPPAMAARRWNFILPRRIRKGWELGGGGGGTTPERVLWKLFHRCSSSAGWLAVNKEDLSKEKWRRRRAMKYSPPPCYRQGGITEIVASRDCVCVLLHSYLRKL